MLEFRKGEDDFTMNIIYITTVSSTVNAFFKTHIENLVDSGHHVDIACNNDLYPIDDFFLKLGCNFHKVDFSRSPLAKSNFNAYKQLKKIIENGNYDIVHCHTPIAAVCTRFACKKMRKKHGVKVFYTAHGFHFYKGAPIKNWMIYYPIEKICSYYTDKLITINREDYELAQKKLKAKEVYYVPGVGLDLSKFENVQVDKAKKRKEIGVPEDAFLLLSVGELNKNKNHQIIIRALAKLNDTNIHYAIAGIGNKKDELLALARELGVSEQIHLLGFRKDIPELNYVSDVFCFPSYREGLGLAALEAMACGLPLITSNVHGINDYSLDGITGYKCAPTDVEGFVNAIHILNTDLDIIKKMRQYNINFVEKYNIQGVLNFMRGNIYE